jgi:ubiquinone/menaquinone biosynthesis C-methylase UbiE
LSKSECKEIYEHKIKHFSIRNGDVVADVGAASGWMEGVLSVFTDSVTYYIQDINSDYLDQDQLDKVVNYFSLVRETTQTNSFHMVIGKTNKTNLPDSTFDKIIIHNTFHEFTNPWMIVKDLKRKLKANGKIIVYDNFSNRYKKIRHPGCKIKARTISFIKRVFKRNGFYLTNLALPESSFSNFLTFELNNDSVISLMNKQQSVEKHIVALEGLNRFEVYRDSVATMQIGHYVKQHLQDILLVYPAFEEYINKLGYILLQRYRNPSPAINVLQVNAYLFPQSSNAFDSLGEAYLKKKDYPKALRNYQKSLELNAGNVIASEKIEELKVKMNAGK